MTKYKSPIKLGEKYRDERSGIEGHAICLIFHTTGCTEVEIEYNSDSLGIKGVQNQIFPEPRLAAEGAKNNTYKSDIELDEYYADEKDELTGRAAFIEFKEHQATRVALRVTQRDRQGNITPKYWMIDEYRLKRVKDGKTVEKQEGQRGPVGVMIDVPEARR